MNTFLALLIFFSMNLPDGDSLLSRIDENTFTKSRMVVASMRITGRRGVRTVRIRSYSRGDSAFVEYLAPEREKGTKMLKLGRDLWIYTPESDRTIRISGHMLRQSVAGSDLSYEDMMEEPRLRPIYRAVTTGSDSIDSRPVWVLELNARSPDVAYPKRKIWVDRERLIVLKEERFSKSGKPLKRAEVLETKWIDSRWVATRVVFRDLLKTGAGTEFVIEEIQQDISIPPALFSKASLRR
ncbi:outer membrane lipoprotein-sorting protein [candidate division WOR-3 bacterium]|nr:outer membrane lipoprotein-sorting protein [candidate division WOR-3 bacterium]